MDELRILTDLAYQYGPFLFALIFNLIITRWGHRIYTTACSRREPPASEREKDTYRLYFLGMASFGMLLVVASILWWVVEKQPEQYIFEGSIKGLKQYEQIASNDMFFKPVYLKQIQEDAPQLRNEKFLVVQDHPFQRGDSFEVMFSKGPNTLEVFDLPYYAVKEAKYRITWDESQQKMVLQDLNPRIDQISFWISTLHAEVLKAPFYSRQQHAPLLLQKKSKPVVEPKKELYQLIRGLQRERTPFFRKKEILIRLLELPFQSWFNQKRLHLSEPILLTLLDLRRSTDKEMAHYVNKVILHHYGNRKEVDQFIKGLLLNNINQKLFDKGVNIIQRIKKRRALRILKSIDDNKKSLNILKLEQKIITEGTRVLIPTAADSGEQYCVKTQWRKKSIKVQQCLRRLKSKHLPKKQTNTPNTAWFFNRTKAKALKVADEIENCGGQAIFSGWGSRIKK